MKFDDCIEKIESSAKAFESEGRHTAACALREVIDFLKEDRVVTKASFPRDPKNIPFMLRHMADDYEKLGSPKTVILLSVRDEAKSPDLYHFGQELNPLEILGAMFAAASKATQP